MSSVDDAFVQSLRDAANRGANSSGHTRRDSKSDRPGDLRSEPLGDDYQTLTEKSVNPLREFASQYKSQLRGWSFRLFDFWPQRQVRENGEVLEKVVGNSFVYKLYLWFSGPKVGFSVIALVLAVIAINLNQDPEILPQNTVDTSAVQINSKAVDDFVVEPLEEPLAAPVDTAQSKSFLGFRYLDCDDLPYPDMRCERAFTLGQDLGITGDTGEADDSHAIGVLSDSDGLNDEVVVLKPKEGEPLRETRLTGELAISDMQCNDIFTDLSVPIYEGVDGHRYIKPPKDQFRQNQSQSVSFLDSWLKRPEQSTFTFGQCTLDLGNPGYFADSCECKVWKATLTKEGWWPSSWVLTYFQNLAGGAKPSEKTLTVVKDPGNNALDRIFSQEENPYAITSSSIVHVK